jgi:WD40 repeat protein/predicted Ser/Thr protein kinase
MSMPKQCPNCGAEITADAVDGLCLKCLGRLGFSPEPGQGQADGLLRLGDYELLAEIARGGMGVVYRARQLSLNRIVALKVVLHGLFSSPDFVRRFRHEARVVAALRHPNIVTIYEVGEDGGNHFLSLEFIEGRNFAELVRERPLPSRQAAGYLKTIAEALEHAHQRGVLHRDLKPSNILLDAFDQPRVTDFGLAKLVGDDGDLTVTGQVLGSPNYMPPEHAAGKFSGSTPASDIYSLGAIAYELLTGRPPFQGETLTAILAQVQTAEPVPPSRLNPGIPADLQTICLKCLQKDPACRYASAQALADDLGRFLEGKPIHARPVPLLERGWLACRRRPLLSALAAGLVLALTSGLGGILFEWRQAERHARGEMEQRELAVHDAAETRLNLYAADVAVASQALQNGDLGRAWRTLASLVPKAGETDLRGFEWRYLWNLCRGDQLASLPGHEKNVTATAFSPDGRLLASGSLDGTVRVWELATYKTIRILTVTSNQVWSVGFTPDGRWLVTGCTEKVELWNTDSWEVNSELPGETAVLAKSGEVLATAASNPFFYEPAGRVRLWNWRTKELLHEIAAPGRALALSPDGGCLALAGTNASISIWDTATGKELQSWAVPHPVWSLSFSPDGRNLLVAGWARDVLVRPLDGRGVPQSIAGDKLNCWNAVFSGDGKLLVTSGNDRGVHVWDAVTREPKAVWRGHFGEIWCAAFSPDGKLLATGGTDKNVLLWRAGTGPTPDELPHDGDFRPLFSADGKWLVTVDPATGSGVLWDVDRRQVVDSRLAEGSFVRGFSSDGKCVVVLDGSFTNLEFWPPHGTNPQRKLPLEGLTPATAPCLFSGLSPAQDRFFAVDGKGCIRIWNPDTGRLLGRIAGPPPPIRNVVISPGGRYLALSLERENVVRLYDCGSGRERELAGHEDFVSGLAFSPDGETLATGSMDGSIRLWATVSGKCQASLPANLGETTDVAFSPDGKTLASLGKNESLKLWHVPTLRQVVFEEAPQAGLWLRFSPDGRKLAVETAADTLRLLDASPQ